jgi:hypothetical protein
MLLKTTLLDKMVRFSSGEKQCPHYESSQKQWLYKYELVMLLLSNVLFFNVMAGNPDGGIVHQDSEPTRHVGLWCEAFKPHGCNV